MFLAENETAREFKKLQNEIDWGKPSDQAQHDKMKTLLEYLYTQNRHIPIYLYGTRTGIGSPSTVQDQIYLIKDRVDRYTRQLNR